MNIDLSTQGGLTSTVKRIVIPESQVRTGLTPITVNYGKSQVRFTPVTMNTAIFKAVDNLYNAYARITEDTSTTAARSYLTPVIRGKKQVSKVHSITFDVSSNESTRAFTQATSTLDYTIYFDAAGLTIAQKSQIQLFKYNTATATYELVSAVLDTTNNRVTARIKDAGHYVLMTNY